MKLKYLVIGGDIRQAYMAASLYKEGHNVTMVFGDNFMDVLSDVQIAKMSNIDMRNYDVIIFPMPISKDSKTLNCTEVVDLIDLVNKVPEDKIILGGGVTLEVKEMFNSVGLHIHDYLQREELAVLNAIPTAEGAIEIAIRERNTTINGSNCLVTGFGRISKVLVKILNGMGAKVMVAARKHKDLAWANIYGADSCHISSLSELVKNKDIIFNTVPYRIFNKKVLLNINKECLIIDLASIPGGFDFDKAKQLDLNPIWALSLPGKVAPKTAGEIIKNTVINIVDEINLPFL